MSKLILTHRPIRSDITYSIGYSSNLLIDPTLFSDKDILINENITIFKNRSDNSLILENSIKENDPYIKNVKGTFITYKHPTPNNHYFEAEDQIKSFETAIRIYKNSACNFNPIIHFEKENYYQPFFFDKKPTPYPHLEGVSIINSVDDLEKIKKICKKLEIAKIERNDIYSKIYNGVKFFNNSYDTGWLLLKTLFSFSLLESLFSDSDKNEITYKIALRTSYFLYPHEPIERLRVFKFIKRGYDVRSAFVHGADAQNRISVISKKFEKEKPQGSYSFYTDFPKELDFITSQCLSKILLSDDYFAFFFKRDSFF